VLWEPPEDDEVVFCLEDTAVVEDVMADVKVIDSVVVAEDVDVDVVIDDSSSAVSEVDSEVLIGSLICSACVYNTGSGALNMNSVTLQHVVLIWPCLSLRGDAPPLLAHHALESGHFQYILSTGLMVSYMEEQDDSKPYRGDSRPRVDMPGL
jgi:hypothetical protein